MATLRCAADRCLAGQHDTLDRAVASAAFTQVVERR